MKQLKNLSDERITREISDTELPIVDEPLFVRMLSLERRRCERTGIPFALMLVHLHGISPALNQAARKELAVALGNAMRETDITGWYQQSSTIGIILTTLNAANIGGLETVVLQRVRPLLASRLTASQVNCVGITFHLFPESSSTGNSVGPDQTFYVDQDKKDSQSTASTVLKRSMDVAGSMAALILLSPLFLVISILIKMTSEGPVFFRQTRIGQFGEKFTFLKFRSMYVNNDPSIHKEYVRNLIDKKVSDSGGTFKIKNDPRITPVGRFLRKSSLDELPQFINVLRGEMSLVGPRPPIPYEFESYFLWHRRRILEAKPGITGEWQVNGRSRTTFDEMVRMDLRYIQEQSIWLDLKILLKTPWAVLNGNGAY
jgi:exopolysaccharide biosynthesis polyprenyl glycosylphosphotransferase